MKTTFYFTFDREFVCAKRLFPFVGIAYHVSKSDVITSAKAMLPRQQSDVITSAEAMPTKGKVASREKIRLVENRVM